MISRTGEHGISRFSRMEFPYMPWFFDRAGPSATRVNVAQGVAFRTTNNVGTPNDMHFAAQ
jgi:hypothetical protein